MRSIAIASSTGGTGGAPAVTITGTTAVGSVLTASITAGYGGTLTYQWVRGADGASDLTGASNISGATSSTYTLVSGDIGRVIGCLVSGLTYQGRTSGVVAGVAPSVTTEPAIVGTPEVGAAASYTTGTYAGTTPITKAVQWLLDGAVIVGETGSTYTPISADEGKSLAIRETASNAWGSAASTSSAAVIAAAGAGGATPFSAEVGIGISGLSYFDQSFAMVDVARQSAFRGLDWGAVDLDANGSPTEDFRLIYSSEVIGAGTYKLKFKGSADVTGTTNKIYDAGTNTTTADFVLASDLIGNQWIDFTNTRRTAGSSVADGLTDIQMFRPGYATDGSDVFTAEFISAMQKFSVIRTMDFISANGNPNENWSDRCPVALKGDPGTKGQSWELMVLMANATNRDLWITIPVKANDAYIDKLAKLIKYGSDGVEPYTSTQASPVYPPLNPSLNLYVEYGNEIWNSGPGFNGFVWTLELANEAMAAGDHPIDHDGRLEGNQYMAQRRWIAYRSAFISQSFRSVFGDAAMMTRVRPIFAAQVANSNTYLSDGLMWAESYYGDVRSLWYGGGGAAYYGSEGAPHNMAPETVTAYFAGMPEADFAARTQTDVMWTKAFGLKTIAYEGGPGPGGSPTGGFSGSAELSYTYNNDPRMQAGMKAAHDVWVAAGGDMLVYYIYSGPAPWSFTNGVSGAVVSDTTSIKMQAIDAIKAGGQPVAAGGTLVPGTVYLRNPAAKVISTEGGNSLWKYDGTAWLLKSTTGSSHQEFLMLPIRVTEAGQYKISMTSYDAWEGDSADIYGNGVPLGTVVMNVGAEGVAVESAKTTVTLGAGLTVLRVRTKFPAWLWLKDLIIEPA